MACTADELRADACPAHPCFEDFYRRYSKDLVRYLQRSCRCDDVESIAQEAFLRAWRSWASYDAREPFWPWLVTIARHVWVDQCRKAARAEQGGTLTGLAGEMTPEDAVLLAEEHRIALLAADQLAPRHRRMIELRDIQGLSYPEIAEVLGGSPNAARVALHRARQLLRQSFVHLIADSA